MLPSWEGLSNEHHEGVVLCCVVDGWWYKFHYPFGIRLSVWNSDFSYQGPSSIASLYTNIKINST